MQHLIQQEEKMRDAEKKEIQSNTETEIQTEKDTEKQRTIFLTMKV